jgi:hypothetical protein
MKVVCLFVFVCHVEISQTMTSLGMFLVSLESFQGGLVMFKPLVPNTTRFFPFPLPKSIKITKKMITFHFLT